MIPPQKKEIVVVGRGGLDFMLLAIELLLIIIFIMDEFADHFLD